MFGSSGLGRPRLEPEGEVLETAQAHAHEVHRLLAAQHVPYAVAGQEHELVLHLATRGDARRR